MASEPITLFAKVADPVHAFRVLREIAPKLAVIGNEHNWSEAIVSTGIWPFRKQLSVSHDPNYYLAPNLSVQLDGMLGYFSRFPDSPQRARALDLIPKLGFALGCTADPDLKYGDYRLTVLQILANELEAVWFTPTSLRDAFGRVLLSATRGENDPEAQWPSYAA